MHIRVLNMLVLLQHETSRGFRAIRTQAFERLCTFAALQAINADAHIRAWTAQCDVDNDQARFDGQLPSVAILH